MRYKSPKHDTLKARQLKNAGFNRPWQKLCTKVHAGIKNPFRATDRPQRMNDDKWKLSTYHPVCEAGVSGWNVLKNVFFTQFQPREHHNNWNRSVQDNFHSSSFIPVCPRSVPENVRFSRVVLFSKMGASLVLFYSVIWAHLWCCSTDSVTWAHLSCCSIQ